MICSTLSTCERITAIEDYIADMDLDGFAQDRKTIDAVVRNLGIIGEAANNLSPGFRARYQELPYRQMVAMRNLVIHEYFGVNERVVWDTCHEDLPILKKGLSRF